MDQQSIRGIPLKSAAITKASGTGTILTIGPYANRVFLYEILFVCTTSFATNAVAITTSADVGGVSLPVTMTAGDVVRMRPVVTPGASGGTPPGRVVLEPGTSLVVAQNGNSTGAGVYYAQANVVLQPLDSNDVDELTVT